MATKRDGEEANIVDCKMFKGATSDAREAVRQVKDGQAERFFKPVSKEEQMLNFD